MRERILDELAREVAEKTCKQIQRRVIRSMQALGADLSGDDTGLENAWDEVCVQVQVEQSFYWDAYERLMLDAITRELQRFSPAVRGAIWLQTSVWDRWYDQDDEPDMDEQDVVEYVYSAYVLSAAADWTNRRIQRYIYSGYSD